MNKTLWLALFCALVLMIPARADIYYVSTNGSNANPGTEAQPWLTLGYADAQLSAGDTLYIREGNYEGSTNVFDPANNGTAASRIIVSAYPNETVIIKNCPDNTWAFDLLGRDYYSVSNLHLVHNQRHLRLETGSNSNIIANCTFGPPHPDYKDWAGVRVWRSSQGNQILSCTFSNWGTSTGCSDYGTPLAIGNYAEDDDDTYYNLVQGCTFTHGGHDCLSLWTGRNVIKGNYFHNEPWLTNYPCINKDTNRWPLVSNRIGEFGDNSGAQRDEWNVIEDNTMMYTGPPVDTDWGGFGIEVATHYCIYRRNVIAWTFAAGIYFSDGGATNWLYNNTIVGCTIDQGDIPSGLSKGGINMSNFTPADQSSNRVVNCIVWANNYINIGEFPQNYQLVGTNWTSGDPMLSSTNGYGDYFRTNASLPNFRLLSGSPCIDAGQFLTTVTSASASGTSLVVEDSGYFTDGNRVVPGDLVQLSGGTATARVTAVDRTTQTLTLSTPLTWTQGQGIALAYRGEAPDIGAYESELNPHPPPNFRIQGKQTFSGNAKVN